MKKADYMGLFSCLYIKNEIKMKFLKIWKNLVTIEKQIKIQIN